MMAGRGSTAAAGSGTGTGACFGTGAGAGAGECWRANGPGAVSSCTPSMLMNLQAKLCTVKGLIM